MEMIAPIKTTPAEISLIALILLSNPGEIKSQILSIQEFIASEMRTIATSNSMTTHSILSIRKINPAIMTKNVIKTCILKFRSFIKNRNIPSKAYLKLCISVIFLFFEFILIIDFSLWAL